MSDDTTAPDDTQSLSEDAIAVLQSLGPVPMASRIVALRHENEALRAQVAAHEDADRRWSADMEALRDTLNAATSRLEAYGAISHVVVGYDDGPVDTVIAACAELPFVRIENKRLRDELADLRRELQAERDFRTRMVADLDARSGEPL